MPVLDAIGIVVKDMNEALTFYRLLGVDIEEPVNGSPHHEAKLPSGLRLMFDTVDLVKQIDPTWEEPTGTRMGMAFLCNSPSDVDDACQKVSAAGYTVRKEPWDAFWGQRYAQVVDPDGNTVDLFAPLEA